MTYRPRGTLARTLYDKIHNDQYLEGYDMRLVRVPRIHNFTNLYSRDLNFTLFFSRSIKQWYTLTKTLPDRYQKKFLALEKPDETTLHWLDRAKEQSSNLWLQLWHLIARTFLSFFMTQTSING